jgi:hypothetical protein
MTIIIIDSVFCRKLPAKGGVKYQSINQPNEKGQTMIYKTQHRKLMIEQRELH